MKPIVQFLRTTLTGGILFLLPVVLLLMVLSKAHAIFVKVSAPFAKKLPDIIFGFDGSNLVAILFLIVLCFISGLLFRTAAVKRWIGALEENILSFLPGYALIKSITADAVGEKVEGMHPVLVQDGDAWNIGFLVEEAEGLCTVFFPEAPRHDSGEIKIVPAASVKKLAVPTNLVARSFKNYCKGALKWIPKN